LDTANAGVEVRRTPGSGCAPSDCRRISGATGESAKLERRARCTSVGRNARDVVSRIACDSGSCSACASRSAATKRGSAVVVGDHQHFGGIPRAGSSAAPCRVVGNQLFGGRDPGRTGTEDLVDLREWSRCRSHRGDRLRAADRETSSTPQASRWRRMPGSMPPGPSARRTEDAPAGSRRWPAGTADMTSAEGSGALPPGT
jgi:hypothetical protein